MPRPSTATQSDFASVHHGQAVAGAHKEGGFLGIGGKQISDAENQALDEISSALGTPPAG